MGTQIFGVSKEAATADFYCIRKASTAPAIAFLGKQGSGKRTREFTRLFKLAWQPLDSAEDLQEP